MENDTLDLEQVRETVTLIGHAVESVDDLTKKVIEARWQFEMVKRNPKLGEVRNPQTGQVMHTYAASDFAKNFEKLTEERVQATEALTALTGAASVDAARMSYLRLVTAYQRLGSLRELQNLIEAGFPKAREEAAGQDLLSTEETNAAIAEALSKLKAVASEIVVPALEVPKIELATGGMFRQ